MIDVANFLSSVSRLDQAMRVLDQAEAAGASPREVLITRACFALKTGDNPAGRAREGTRATGSEILASRSSKRSCICGRRTDEHAADQALAVLDAAATQYPGNLEVERKRVDVVINYQKWHAARARDRGPQGGAVSEPARDLGSAHGFRAHRGEAVALERGARRI